MTEFTETLRHHCRNPRCRSKLPMPVSNPREAFCTKGCHSSFYLHCCLACEGPLQRKREDQKVCRKAKCRNAWRAGSGFGRYMLRPMQSWPRKPLILLIRKCLSNPTGHGVSSPVN